MREQEWRLSRVFLVASFLFVIAAIPFLQVKDVSFSFPCVEGGFRWGRLRLSVDVFPAIPICCLDGCRGRQSALGSSGEGIRLRSVGGDSGLLDLSKFALVVCHKGVLVNDSDQESWLWELSQRV